MIRTPQYWFGAAAAFAVCDLITVRGWPLWAAIGCAVVGFALTFLQTGSFHVE